MVLMLITHQVMKKLCMASVSKEVGASTFLPDEIVVLILKKTELKTLRICKRVCRRFYQLIDSEVDSISFNAPPRWKTNNWEFCTRVYSFADRHHHKFNNTRFGRRFVRLVDGLINYTIKFTRIRSLNIELPLSSVKGLQFPKWKVFMASNRIDSFVLLLSTSIHDTKGSSYVNGNDGYEIERRYLMSSTERECLKDAFVRHRMLLGFARECPFLEKISITDKCKRGRISLGGAKLSEVRKSFTAPPEYEDEDDDFSCEPQCHVPMLDLPVSALVMEGVKLLFDEEVDLPYGYSYKEEDDFEDKEEAAYGEALMKILKKHSDWIHRPLC